MPTKKAATSKSRKKSPGAALSDEQKQAMIAEMAYSFAESRGFDGGDPFDDWILAEQQVEKMAGNQ